MSTKHFSDDAGVLVTSALRAAARINPALGVDEENKVVYRAFRNDHIPKVSLISGGGSGHEPAFAGYVGYGFLDAAVAGTIFASPSAQQVYRGITAAVDGTKGVLVIVMNYTGDCLHFGMAVEKAKAAGRQVEMLVVGDDVGVGRSRNGRIGRRGIAGTILVQKIAGACAAAGHDLSTVHKIAAQVSSNLVSVGASLAHVHVPGRHKSEDAISSTDEVEIGMGIHNEDGFGRVKTDLPGLVKTMLAQLLDPSDSDRAFVNITAADSTVLLINNLGGVSPLELGAISGVVIQQLQEQWNIKPKRVISGTYMTSLNGLGFSISILKLSDTGLGQGQSMLEFLDTPTGATAWTATIPTFTWEHVPDKSIAAQEADVIDESNLKVDLPVLQKALTGGLENVIRAEPKVTEYDTLVGDGDCGIGLKRGAEAVLELLNSNSLPDDAVTLVAKIAHVVETNMDGTSGAIYAIFVNAISNSLASEDTGTTMAVSTKIWASTLTKALDSLSRYTPAQPGDRTLIDALDPFIKTLASTLDVHAAVKAAEAGTEKTQGMQASLGRTVYVGGDAFKKCPDPGAYGLTQFLVGLAQSL